MSAGHNEGPLTSCRYSDFTNKKVLSNGFPYSEVYIANHPGFGKCVLKVFSSIFVCQQRSAKKLEDEINLLAKVKHPNLIKILAFVMESQHLCQVLEHALYGDVRDAVRRLTIPWPLKTRISHELSLGMCFLHSYAPEPIVHTKLTARNVLLDEQFHVKISDFKLPKHDQWSLQTTQQRDVTDRRLQARGDQSVFNRPGVTIAHVPPESLRNINTKPMPAYDVYSYGVILWELMSNLRPFGDYRSSTVFEMVTAGELLSDEDLMTSRPQVLYEVMKETFKESEQRPAFTNIRDRIQPTVDEQQAAEDANKCVQDYEDYLERKRRSRSQANAGVVSQTAQPPSRAFLDSATRPEKRQEASQTVLVHPDPPTARPPAEPTVSVHFQADESGPSTSIRTSISGQSSTDRDNLLVVMQPEQDVSDDEAIANESVAIENTMEVEGAPAESMQDGAVPFAPTSEPQLRESDLPTLPARDPSREEVDRVATDLGISWRRMGRVMMISEGTLDGINHDYERQGLYEKCYQTLQYWLKMNPEATIRDLAEILVKIEKYEIVGSLLDLSGARPI